MKFEKIELDTVLAELCELPSDWMDDAARELVGVVKESVGGLRKLRRPITRDDLATRLRNDSRFLDVCRLFLGKGQETVAHELSAQLGMTELAWTRLRSIARQEPDRIAQALAAIGLPETITTQLGRRWRVEDVLLERYKLSRGRAIAGQQRGRGLENDVADVLDQLQIPFQPGVTFTGRKAVKAKCDFAIPSKEHPKIVIEAKGFEATGSKLTDFLGDVLKIGQAKDFHMYFFLVTDGRGWRNRISDLRKIVAYHHEGLIDMIYTRARLPQLGAAVQQICSTE